MERLLNRYPKISQLHGTPFYKGLSLFYPKLSEKALTLQGIFDEHLGARLQQDARIKAW